MHEVQTIWHWSLLIERAFSASRKSQSLHKRSLSIYLPWGLQNMCSSVRSSNLCGIKVNVPQKSPLPAILFFSLPLSIILTTLKTLQSSVHFLACEPLKNMYWYNTAIRSEMRFFRNASSEKSNAVRCMLCPLCSMFIRCQIDNRFLDSSQKVLSFWNELVILSL
jgi:hypothetical protein